MQLRMGAALVDDNTSQETQPLAPTSSSSYTDTAVTAAPSSSTDIRECSICLSVATQPMQLTNCSHTFCRDCLKSYLEEFIRRGMTQFVCPEITTGTKRCNAALTTKDVYLAITCDSQLLDKLRQSEQLLQHKSARACPTCGHVQLKGWWSHDMQCNACSMSYCAVHGGSHSGMTCRQHRAKVRSEESVSYKLIQSDSKNCPKCSRLVHKYEGCNHMSCPAPCLQHWCWLCGRKVNMGNGGAHWAGKNVFSRCRNRQYMANKEPLWLFGLRMMLVLPLVALNLHSYVLGFLLFLIVGSIRYCKTRESDFRLRRMEECCEVTGHIFFLFPIEAVLIVLTTAVFVVMSPIRLLFVRLRRRPCRWLDYFRFVLWPYYLGKEVSSLLFGHFTAL